MNPLPENEQPDAAMRTAVGEWQKKYNVHDGDPLFASLELFRIYFGNTQSAPKSDTHRIPSFVEFRDSLELLDECGKRFSKQAAELIDAMRGVPNVGKQLRSYHTVVFILTALITLLSGIFIGMFIL